MIITFVYFRVISGNSVVVRVAELTKFIYGLEVCKSSFFTKTVCTENYKVGQNNYKVGQLLRITKWSKYYYK